MKTTTALVVAGVALLALAAGCQGRRVAPPGVAWVERTVSIADVAKRLGLRIDEQDETFVVMRKGSDTVLLFTHDDGRFFVNGKPIGSVGKVKMIGGVIHVQEALVDKIRSQLGAAPPPPVRPPVTARRATIVVDPGHGGRDPGTTAAAGVYEKTVNLKVSSKLAGLLRRKGHDVVMTRQDDRYIELESRAAIANRRRAGLLVSIHADSASDPGVQGFTVYIANDASRQSQRIAQKILRAMKTAGFQSRGIRRADYRVLVKTRGPAVLIELGYLSNRWEARKLQEDAYQNRLATAIATGIGSALR